MESILENKSILRDRLEKVRTAIYKATDDAWKQSTTTIAFGNNSYNNAATSPRSVSLNDGDSDNSNNNNNNKNAGNASFLLGMDLFGQDVSVLERGIRDKLEEVEEELSKLLSSAAEQTTTLDESTMTTDNDEDDSGGEALSPQELAYQAKSYQHQIQFLKQASLARTALDESMTLSSVALATTEPNMVQASQELMKALDHLQQAQDVIAVLGNDDDAGADGANPNANPVVVMIDDDEDAIRQQQQQVVANQILTSIRQGIRRHRVELVLKAGNVLDTSIQINNNINDASTTNNATTATSSVSGNAGNAPSLSSTVVPATSGGLSAKSSAQLEAAYQVLEILEGGHSALQESMRRLSQRLYKEVLEPILETHRQANLYLNSSSASSPSSSSSSSSGAFELVPWKVMEAADKPSMGLVGVNTATTKGTVHRLEWSRDYDNANAISDKQKKNTLEAALVAWKDTFQLLDRILSFVQSKILLERPKLCHLVGMRLFGKPHALPSALKLEALGLESSRLGDDRGILMETLVELISQTCLESNQQLQRPTSTELSKIREQLVEFCIPFCRSMAAKQLLPEPDARPKLVAFCQDFEKNFVDHRRCVLLNEARDILTNTDYHNTVQVGVEVSPPDDKDDFLKVFQLHRSSISETASKLMKLVRKTMDESVEAAAQVKNDSSALALLRPTLYRTARDMLHLFRAMIPAIQGAQVRQVPRTAAVLHNDCIFFTHHCLTLGLEYKEKFGSDNDDKNDESSIRGKLLRQTCLFVDMVPLFRELADQCMGDMLDMQKNQLAEIVGSRIHYFGKSLASKESLHEWSEAETALAAGLYHLRHLSQAAWKPVLSKEVYGRCLGYLADVLFALYLQQLLSNATRISSSARSFVSTLFQKAISDIHGLLSDGSGYNSNNNNKGSNNINSNTILKRKTYISSISMEWDKFTAIQQCLDMSSLSDIESALSRGVFRSVASQELARLIRAIFIEDSIERNHLLNQLATVGE